MKKEDLAKMMEVGPFQATTTYRDLEYLCRTTIENKIRTVCVSPYYVKKTCEIVKGTGLRVLTAVGFPFGYTTTETKVFEIKKAIADGVTDIDAVMNLGAFLNGEYEVVEKDIKAVMDASEGVLVKVIVEAAALEANLLTTAAKIVESAGAPWIKTGTGYTWQLVRPGDVRLLKSVVPNLKIKAAGGSGIQTWAQTKALIEAGAEMFGLDIFYARQMLDECESY
ncbi:MAG: deoxyribose-phosphate aldolase [Candidatus Humimicrobiaceae bacterium]